MKKAGTLSAHLSGQYPRPNLSICEAERRRERRRYRCIFSILWTLIILATGVAGYGVATCPLPLPVKHCHGQQSSRIVYDRRGESQLVRVCDERQLVGILF